MDSSRTILHVDMDAFFAQVEKKDHPELEGECVIVGGLGPRGVVSTASYEAREYGVHSAMPMSEARRRCPDAVYRSPRHERYRECSERIREIFRAVTPLVQPLSLDEAFLDVSGSLHRFGSPRKLGEHIRERILQKTDLTASVGAGPNKMIAKMASDECKPDGLRVVPETEVQTFLRDRPIGDLWGVGEKTEGRMRGLGIHRIGDLRRIDRTDLMDEFGERALIYKQRAQGVDEDPVTVHEPTKSVSHERTFEQDLEEPERIEDTLYELLARVARRLRRKGLEGRTVFIKVRRGDFTTLTRSRTLPDPTNNTEPLWEVTRRLIQERFELDSRGVRLVGVGVSNLREAGVQRGLFETSEEERKDHKQDRINALMDEINEQYGDDVIQRARRLKED